MVIDTISLIVTTQESCADQFRDGPAEIALASDSRPGNRLLFNQGLVLRMISGQCFAFQKVGANTLPKCCSPCVTYRQRCQRIAKPVA